MPELPVDGLELVHHMSALEGGGGHPARIGVPLRAVTSVRVVDDAWPEPHDRRAPGTGLPDVIAVGPRRGGFGQDFAAVDGATVGPWWSS